MLRLALNKGGKIMGLIKSDYTSVSKRIRWLARGFGALTSLIGLIFISVGVIFLIQEKQFELHSAIAIVIWAVMIGGLILAFRWEGLGGIITVLGTIAFGIYFFLAEGYDSLNFLWAIIILFLIPSVLFLICWLRTKIMQKQQSG
jgi:hypothetical protein